jgi:hypothetical protein
MEYKPNTFNNPQRGLLWVVHLSHLYTRQNHSRYSGHNHTSYSCCNDYSESSELLIAHMWPYSIHMQSDIADNILKHILSTLYDPYIRAPPLNQY